MSADTAHREPTMEEILASIRRIISEEDKPADQGGDILDLQPPPAAEIKAPDPVPAPPPRPDPPQPLVSAEPPPPPAPLIIEDEVVVVEDEDPPPPPVAVRAPEPAAKPAPAPAAPPVDTETLVSPPVALHTAGALGKLMGSMMVSGGGTLDDIVRELLKPMLKEWLDENLAQIVEAEVAKEIDRIRRLTR